MILDKRIGEKDNNLSAEDKMIARFTAERVKGAGKTSIFNLGDFMVLKVTMMIKRSCSVNRLQTS